VAKANKKRTREMIAIDRLYKAVQLYVESQGGRVAVIGGVAVGTGGERPMNFLVQVNCTGIPPSFALRQGEKQP
jgi:hypothetical protein